MGLGARLAFFAGVPLVGLALLAPDAAGDGAAALFMGMGALVLVGTVVVAWIHVLRSGKEIARRYVDQRLHAPARDRS